MPRLRLAPLFLCLSLAACATHATPEDAQMANALCDQGKLLLSSGKYGDANDIYASATHRDAYNVRAWNGLGASYDLLGKRDAALDVYQHALDIDPNDRAAINNLAHLDIEMGRPEEAVKLLTLQGNDPDAPAILQQNLDTARKAVQVQQQLDGNNYADLGSYPTEGMAQGHIAEVRQILGRDAKGLTFSVVPEVKTGGGIPVFTLKATGTSPQSICDEMNARAFPCIPNGK